MRLIDADELITAFPCGESVRTESVRATIKNMPTIEVSEDCISREYIKTLFENNLTGTCKDVVVHTIANAPSVVPKRSCYRCGLREVCEDSTEEKRHDI